MWSHELSEEIAAITSSDLGPSIRHAAARTIFDTLTCALAARAEPTYLRACRIATTMFAGSEQGLWFSEARSSRLGVAYAASNAAAAYDLDEGHRAAVGHAAAAVIPAVLAVGSVVGSTWEEMLVAIVCGYEAGIQIAKRRDPQAVSTFGTGRWSAGAVAVGTAKLFGSTVGETAHALAIAESLAPNLLAADHGGYIGSDVKEGIPWSAVTGIMSAEQARLGDTGYLGAFDDPRLYRPDPFIGPRQAGFAIESSYLKRYGTCRWIQAALDAAIEIRSEIADVAQIETIEVGTFGRVLTLNNLCDPPDIVSAQFSMPFCIALALIGGVDDLAPIRSAALHRADLIALARKVRIEVDPALDACFPRQVPARLAVTCGAHRLERLIPVPLGDPANPMSDEVLVEKGLSIGGHKHERSILLLTQVLGLRGASPSASPLSVVSEFVRQRDVIDPTGSLSE